MTVKDRRMDRVQIFKSFPHNPDFKHLWKQKLLKTLWENEKMLVTSIFSPIPRCFPSIPKRISVFKVQIAANYKGVCLQNTSRPHSCHLKIW